uniref:Uncharacterized protein n=1 Tax=Anguilla anguilla TaxID=7936 RepID=A0A0E9U5E7_ANGAN
MHSTLSQYRCHHRHRHHHHHLLHYHQYYAAYLLFLMSLYLAELLTSPRRIGCSQR